MFKMGCDGLIHGQRNPQLNSVEGFDAFRCLFGVGDAVGIACACGHQINLFGANQLAKA